VGGGEGQTPLIAALKVKCDAARGSIQLTLSEHKRGDRVIAPRRITQTRVDHWLIG